MIASFLALAAFAAPQVLPQVTTCDPAWLPAFGAAPGFNGDALASVVFDDGSGAKLYVGGEFTVAGDAPVANIASWDGSVWAPVGDGLNGPVRALAVYDDGSGDALYAGGSFFTAQPADPRFLAKWDGSTWTTVGGGVSADVRAFAVWDDGSGPALFVGGDFNVAGGIPFVNRIAKWNGVNWAPLSTGITTLMNNRVTALVVHTDVNGTALYVGGWFTGAGGIFAPGVARWNGTQWRPLGSGLASTIGTPFVEALASYTSGSTSRLYAGGTISLAGGAPVSNIAAWDGTGWSALGSGTAGAVFALRTHDDGSGEALYVGGLFSSAGGLDAGSVARWNGTTWSALPGGLDSAVRSFTSVSESAGDFLYATGSFLTAGGIEARRIARWDGANFKPATPGTFNGTVAAVRTFDDGTGPALYAGGTFTSIGGQPIARLARFKDGQWSAVGAPLNGTVLTMEVLDSGAGPALHVGGNFTLAGSLTVNGLAAWDGTAWSGFGSGFVAFVGPFNPPGAVNAIAMHNDGTGPALYAGGQFHSAGGVGANNIARWNGSAWSALPTPLPAAAVAVNSLTVADLGSGPELVAGTFISPFAGPNAVLRWNGSAWLPLGAGFSSSSFFGVGLNQLVTFDDGSGTALYVGGAFGSSGAQPVRNLARWNGTAWVEVGGGTAGVVRALRVVDDGTGPALFVGGDFTSVGQSISTSKVARWDGANWTPMANFVDGSVLAIEAREGLDGPAVWVGGSFTTSPAGDGFLGLWKACGLGSFTLISGCLGVNSAELKTTSPGLVQGQTATFVSSSAQGEELAIFVAGAPFVVPGGCGFPTSGPGEWLLFSLAPTLLAVAAPTVNGSAAFQVPVPTGAGLAGLSIGFQSVHLALSLPGVPASFSNSLTGQILP